MVPVSRYIPRILAALFFAWVFFLIGSAKLEERKNKTIKILKSNESWSFVK